MPNAGTHGARTIVVKCERSAIGVRTNAMRPRTKPAIVVSSAIQRAKLRGKRSSSTAPLNVTYIAQAIMRVYVPGNAGPSRAHEIRSHAEVFLAEPLTAGSPRGLQRFPRLAYQCEVPVPKTFGQVHDLY